LACRAIRANAKSPPLTDGEINDPFMPPQYAPIEMHHLARRCCFRLQPLYNRRIAAGRDKADVLAVRLFGDNAKPHARGKCPRLGLCQIAKRKAQKLELLARGGEEEIALVALKIARAAKLAPGLSGAA